MIVHEAGRYTLRPVSAPAQEWFKTNVKSTRPLTLDQVRVGG